MFSVKPLVTALMVIVFGLAAGDSTGAHPNAKHTMYVTFSGPVALPGVSLGTGTYIFEVPEANGDHSLVRVLSRDRSIVFLTTFTLPVDRPAGMKLDQTISFAEAKTGQPQPISVWWPEGAAGRKFIYRTK
jgi:hypothetical protein